MKASKNGSRWSERETQILSDAYAKGKSYSQIASMKTFSGKRSLKALRRKVERDLV